MQIHRILSIGLMLAATGLLMPHPGFAQQTATSQQESEEQEAASRALAEMLDRGRGGNIGFDEEEAEGTVQSGGAANVQVIAAADERTNTVVVRGPAEMLDLVADVLASLDETTAKIAGVKVYQLRYADAMNVADVINNLFNEEQRSSRSDDRAGPMFFRGPFPGGTPGGQQEAGGNMAQVVAAADSRTNSVVVTGPDSVLSVIDGVIKSLDTPLPNVADVKVFHLEYADAVDTAELINEVFGEQSGMSSSSSRSSQQTQRVSFMRGGFGMPGGGGQSGQGGLSDVAVIASADSRTNSVVVSGPPETLTVVEQIVKELDENPEEERRIFVYALKNGNATNLMTILNNLFEEMRALTQQSVGGTSQQFQGGQRGAAPGGAASGGGTASSDSSDLSEQTYFEADPNTNSLLCMTSTKNYDKIKPIIEDLDKPVGQVLIKILFAELTHSNSIDWGTEFSMLNLNSGGSTQSTQVFGRPTSQFLPGSDTLTSPTGLSVRTIQGDIDLTVHALQETGRLNVLSRPYVLTRNNQMATISIAEEVPIPTGTSQGTATTTTNFDYRSDIGIVLEVTPSINPDGLVNMIVSPAITTRTGETVQISESLFPEVFATRSASTRVAVRDGQTIVIGGLIEDQIKDIIKKVPLLGDIPLAGNLFRRVEKEKTKTELLIFLTPHVAEEPNDLTPISNAERERSNLNTDEQASEIFKKHMDAMENRED